MSKTVSNVPAPVEFVVYQGATFGPLIHELHLSDGSLMDLTGATVTGQVRITAASANVVATFDCLVLSPPDAGQYALSLSPTATAAIPAADSPWESGSAYEYDVQLTLPSGVIMTTLQGTLRAFREVTRVA